MDWAGIHAAINQQRLLQLNQRKLLLECLCNALLRLASQANVLRRFVFRTYLRRMFLPSLRCQEYRFLVCIHPSSVVAKHIKVCFLVVNLA